MYSHAPKALFETVLACEQIQIQIYTKWGDAHINTQKHKHASVYINIFFKETFMHILTQYRNPLIHLIIHPIIHAHKTGTGRHVWPLRPCEKPKMFHFIILGLVVSVLAQSGLITLLNSLVIWQLVVPIIAVIIVTDTAVTFPDFGSDLIWVTSDSTS